MASRSGIKPASDDEDADGEAYVYLLTKPPASPRHGQAGRGAAEVAAAATLDLPDSVFWGPGSYQIDPWVTDRHNLRAAPRIAAHIVGSLHAGDIVEVTRVVTVMAVGVEDELAREHWAQLFRKSPGPPAWAMLEDSSGKVFLRYVRKPGLKAPTPAVRQAAEDEPSELDRNITAILGRGSEDNDTVADLVDRIMEHEMRLADSKIETHKMQAKADEADDKRKQKQALSVIQDMDKATKAKQKQQRETWELERPQLRMRTVNTMAMLDQTTMALDRQYQDRVQAIKDKHLRARAIAAEMEKPDYLNLAEEGSGDEDKAPLNIEDKALISAELAREAASDAAKGLSGVSDTSLAEALVAMEAASAHAYRKLVFKPEDS